MNIVETKPPKTNTSIQQLQVLALKIAELAERSERLLQKDCHQSVSQGLVSIGLCKQAREQVSAACQNLGFAVETLPFISNPDTNCDLEEAAAGVVEVVQQTLNVPGQTIAPAIAAFVDEMLVIAAITVCRADEHVKAGEKLIGAVS